MKFWYSIEYKGDAKNRDGVDEVDKEIKNVPSDEYNKWGSSTGFIISNTDCKIPLYSASGVWIRHYMLSL